MFAQLFDHVLIGKWNSHENCRQRLAGIPNAWVPWTFMGYNPADTPPVFPYGNANGPVPAPRDPE